VRNHKLEIKNYNHHFIQIKSSNQFDLTNFGKSIFDYKFNFIDEVLVTPHEIVLKINSIFQSSDIEKIKELTSHKRKVTRAFKLPIFFTAHPDWLLVLNKLNLSRTELISLLINKEYTLAMFGFLPGFLYLKGLDPKLKIERKATPAKKVEAGTIALGNNYLGVYSLETPGGWHVIGKTPIQLLRENQIPPLEISPNDKVNLELIDESEYTQLMQNKTTLTEYNA